MPQGSIHWQGAQRRSCAPGANWNVQVVRGKVTTRCLWHACKALGIGLLLMLLGACMATIGYYADQLSMAQEIRGNMTVHVKNESRGFHLNNLSYAGPIVMGVGGFIVVAACVMTFEARDSAAKVVPARFRMSQGSSLKSMKQRNRRSTSCQTSKWDQIGLFRVNKSPSPSAQELTRKQMTAEFMKFSKQIQEKGVHQSLKKSPSAPTLIDKKSPRRRPPKFSGCALLNPELLQRHALSVDNPGYSPQQVSKENLMRQKTIGGSQASMALDLHIPNKGPVTLKIKDRSDTARRHQLLRQTNVEDVEEVDETKQQTSHVTLPKLPGTYCKYPDDFVPRKRNSVDLKLLEDLGIITKNPIKTSPRDFRKISSPNFRKMSFDRIGGERKFDRNVMMGQRKASLEFRKSPDFRRHDYRKLSSDRFSVDCTRYPLDETEMKSRTNSGENLKRQRHPKLHHSRSDDNRRQSFDKYHNKDSHRASRYSLNTPLGPSFGTPVGPEPESKYFVATSLDTEESRAEYYSDESHVIDIDDEVLSSEGPTEADALLEEPELENLTEIDVESPIRDVDNYEQYQTEFDVDQVQCENEPNEATNNEERNEDSLVEQI